MEPEPCQRRNEMAIVPKEIEDAKLQTSNCSFSYHILSWKLFLKVSNSYLSSFSTSHLQYRYNIMTACWKLEPTQRPTFSQICTLIQKQFDAIKEQVNGLFYKIQKKEAGSAKIVFTFFSFCHKSCHRKTSKTPYASPLNPVLPIYTQIVSFICMAK